MDPQNHPNKLSHMSMQDRKESTWAIELTRFRLFRFLFANKYVQPLLQILSVALFALALYEAFYGPQIRQENFGSIVLLGLWWSPVMIISMLVLGRAWCYVCPMGAISNTLQRFSLNRKFPTFRKKWFLLGLGFSILSLSTILYIFMRFAIMQTEIPLIPAQTGLFFLIILLLMVGVTLIFERRAFCRYICPITSAMTVTSKLTPLEIVHSRDKGVRNCVTAEFQSNYFSSDHRCVYCMKCTTEHPQSTVQLRWRWPGAAAVKEKFPLVDEALIALILYAVFPMNHLVTPIVGKYLYLSGMPVFAAKMMAYLASILITIFLYTIANKISANWSGLDFKVTFTRFAYAYVPLWVMFFLGMAVVPTILMNGGGLLNGVASGLGISLNLPVEWASEEIMLSWYQFSMGWYPILIVAWSGFIAWQIARDMAKSPDQAFKAFLPHLIYISFSMFAIMAQLLGI